MDPSLPIRDNDASWTVLHSVRLPDRATVRYPLFRAYIRSFARPLDRASAVARPSVIPRPSDHPTDPPCPEFLEQKKWSG